MPQDDMFYDGYDDFIRNIEQDLNNNSFDIYKDKEDSSASSQGGKAGTNANGRLAKSQQRSKRKRKPAYERDPTDDMSRSVNEQEVMRLIVQRSKAQQDRNFVLADDILDELNNVHEVYVWDRDGLWSCSSIAPGRRFKNNYRIA